MIEFSRSSFTWTSHPWQSDPQYRWKGGFVGQPGESYQVRFTLEARCLVTHLESNVSSELFLGAPCRSEYTIARRNLFQVPSGEWRTAFSRHAAPTIAKRSSAESEPCQSVSLTASFADHEIDVRELEHRELGTVAQVAQATLANDHLGARTRYRDERGFEVELEYPVNVMNLNADGSQFQVCTGPVLLPDLDMWDGREVHRVFQAHVAVSDFDFAEFILRQEIDAAAEVRAWLDRPRGRDRLELIDPDEPPDGYPPARPKPHAYNETWELDAVNTILAHTVAG